MNMAVAEAVIILEVEKLKSLLAKKANLRKDTKLEVEKLINEIESFLGLVRDKKLEEGRCRLKYLISDVIEMARDAHQLIWEIILWCGEYCPLYSHVGVGSTWTPTVAHTPICECCEQCPQYHDRIPQLIGPRLSSICIDLRETNELLRQEMRVMGSPNEGVGEGEGDVVGFEGVGEGEEDVVGFEEDLKLLFHKIDNHMNLSQRPTFVACIHGIAGSGKTTLARQLYTHADVVHNYEHRAWVNCTGFISRKELLINLIRKVAADGDLKDVEAIMEHANTESLQNMLTQQLQGKRFFIVLDDIYGVGLQQHALKSFNNDDKRSIVLLTCQRTANSYLYDYLHDMKPLDLDKSWQLLLKMIFCGNNKFPKHLERKGKNMLMKHTGGVPLAIKEVAMEWAEKRRLGLEWEEVVDSEDLELRATLAALELSVYHNLDPDEKSCFLHLGLFKQGTTIRSDRLVQTWIATGVLMSQEEYVYRTCLSKLMERNIIEVELNAKLSDRKYFYVTAIFHKLSIKKAIEENNGVSQRVVYCSRDRFNCSTNQDERLICLFFNGGGCFDGSPSYWKCFEQLRVLEFEGFGLKFIPETVGELIELRYLGLRNNHIKELPLSLGNLKNLEVLDIALNFMVKVPDIIWEMEALGYLYMSDIFCRKPLKIEALKNLKTLTYISIDNWAYEVSGLRMMKKLRKLGIEEVCWNSDVSKLFASLAALESLKCLVLKGFRFRSIPSLDNLGVLHGLNELKLDGLITKLPTAENFPPNIIYLTLVNSCLDADPITVLERLSRLRSLKLKNAYTGPQMVISEGGFPRLADLYIEELWHLRNILVGPGALRQLQTLKITRCPFFQTPSQ